MGANLPTPHCTHPGERPFKLWEPAGQGLGLGVVVLGGMVPPPSQPALGGVSGPMQANLHAFGAVP